MAELTLISQTRVDKQLSQWAGALEIRRLEGLKASTNAWRTSLSKTWLSPCRAPRESNGSRIPRGHTMPSLPATTLRPCPILRYRCGRLRVACKWKPPQSDSARSPDPLEPAPAEALTTWHTAATLWMAGPSGTGSIRSARALSQARQRRERPWGLRAQELREWPEPCSTTKASASSLFCQ
jgi:hypothetical protein